MKSPCQSSSYRLYSPRSWWPESSKQVRLSLSNAALIRKDFSLQNSLLHMSGWCFCIKRRRCSFILVQEDREDQDKSNSLAAACLPSQPANSCKKPMNLRRVCSETHWAKELANSAPMLCPTSWPPQPPSAIAPGTKNGLTMPVATIKALVA